MRPMRLPVARTGRTGRTGHTERTGRTGRTGRTEGGSVLMLVPAGFLILMLFAGIAVDSAAAYLGQRQLSDALSAAANDAATAGLDDADYYRSGAVTLDPATTATAVCRSLQAQGDGDLHRLTIAIGTSGAVVEVRGTAEIDAVFGRLIPHFGVRQVSAQVTADAQQGPARHVTTPGVLTPVSC
jgi:Flp pilus assembly protein TadG